MMKYTNQPMHLCSLIRVFLVHMKKLCILGYPKCAQVSVNAQADPNLCWAHMFKGMFSNVAKNYVEK